MVPHRVVVMYGPTSETRVRVGVVLPSTVGADGLVAASDQFLVDRGFTGTGQSLHQIVPFSHSVDSRRRGTKSHIHPLSFNQHVAEDEEPLISQSAESYSVRQCRAISARVVTHTFSRERTWVRKRSSARARPGRPTIRQCRPTFIIRPPSSYSCSNVSTRYV